MTELFPSDLVVMLSAEAADIIIRVGATFGQRHDVIRHGSGSNDPGFLAHAAEWFVAEPALP